mgnify:FL=1|tara:strand:+ start:771 stop:1220 length:450 start_codon:yes stop_codon:yes gene_type:complete
MNNKIEKIHVNYSEYCYFDYLSDTEGLEYFFNLFEGQNQTKALNLQQFFEDVSTELDINDTEPTDNNLVSLGNAYPDSVNRVDVMIDDEYIVIESNSLKAIRILTVKFMEAGYIISRDLKTEKMFKKDKTTRYLRVFYIIDQTIGICPN